MGILSPRGVRPEMEFRCCKCGETFTGQQVINRDIDLYIVSVDKENPINSTFRCEPCQDDYETYQNDYYSQKVENILHLSKNDFSLLQQAFIRKHNKGNKGKSRRKRVKSIPMFSNDMRPADAYAPNSADAFCV